MKKLYSNFTKLYSLSKTLRFELIPQGNTLENMKLNGVIEDDEYKAECYKKVKKMIDEYHKEFIDEVLTDFKFDNSLSDYYLKLKNNADRKELDKLKDKMRKEISNSFIKNPKYKSIFGKEIITKILPEFYKDNSDNLNLINEFSKFTTYFKGFNENRKNMYTADAKSTAISYRLINENLDIFISNINLFNKIQNTLPHNILEELYTNLNTITKIDNLPSMFEIDYYNNVLTQNGIDIYNQVIGGYSKEDGSKVKGINEYINEYRQTHPEDKNISKLSPLYKQILSNSTTMSFVIDKIESDEELINMINELSIKINNEIIESKTSLEQFLNDICKCNLEKIYIKNDLAITEISQYLYGEWSEISQAIRDEYDRKNGKPKNEKQEEKKKKALKNIEYFSLAYINECLKNDDKNINIEQYFIECSHKNEKGDKINIFDKYNKRYNDIKLLLKNGYPENQNLKTDYKNITLIKDYLDSIKEIQLFIKPLVGVKFKDEYEKDNAFYDKLFDFWTNMNEITSVYNKTRNYLTGKPYSKDKIKLNFKNPTLLDGWCLGNEITNSSLLFRKNGLYYIGIINNNDTSYFKKYESPKNEDDVIEKMEFEQVPKPGMSISNLMIIDNQTVLKTKNLENLKNEYLPKDINEIRKSESYLTSSANFSKKNLSLYLDYYKERVKEYYDQYEFNFKNSSEYTNYNDFAKDVKEQAYKLFFKKISYEYITQLVYEGKLYLFQIYNKDFSKNSHGTPNLHTLYWKMLFDEENLKNIVYALGGQAEIFYRKSSIERKVTHPKGQKISNKNVDNPKKESLFEYDLIKDKRYTEDKFLFHVPIELNFKNIGLSNINEAVNKTIKYSDDNYVIGIDRGERHLLYLVLINSKGEIVEQYTLNQIINQNNGISYKTDYHKLLDLKEKERENARESWQSIDNIKNLKEGYLSQAINKITDLMIKYNAVVVLEDLNHGFMRGRQKFEKQVYQKFEKMLIDKLNYLVKKDIDKNDEGGLLNAYQLTNKFESFKTMGKQSGFLYYIPAWNTSKMDPVTGFVNLFYVKYENENKAHDFFEKIDNIRYNKKKNYFEFDIDYDKFTTKADGTKTKWTLCTYGNRVKTERNKEKNSQWDSTEIDLTNEFKKLFQNNNINIESASLKDEILNVNGKEFWNNLIKLFKLMLQMRNSITGTEIDYIISPVANEKGEFYDSRKGYKNLPNNADANGAYNIARKGLWVIEQIKNTPDEELKKPKIAISNKEWLSFVQENFK